MKICFLIRSLSYGGAERQLIALAKQLSALNHQVFIVTFYSENPLVSELIDSPIKIISLKKISRWDIFGFLKRLLKTLRSIRPDVVHSYLEMANLLALCSRPWLKRCKIVWGVRASNLQLADMDWLGKLETKLNLWLANSVDLIISNSLAGKEIFKLSSHTADNILVIPNGIDTERFKPNLNKRLATRQQLKLPSDTLLIGMIARLHPMKGHRVFIEAAKRLVQLIPNIHLICIGKGNRLQEQKLANMIEQYQLTSRMQLLQPTHHIEHYYQALDIAVTPSLYGEGFTNAVAEAMATGIPCIGSDVGDIANIIDNPALIVPPNDIDKLATTIQRVCQLTDNERQTVGNTARQRIIDHFSLSQLGQQTEQHLLALCAE